EMPPPDLELGGPVVDIHSAQHNCVLYADDTVACWGYGASGRLGSGTISSIGDNPGEMPPPLVDLVDPVYQIGLGNEAGHTCVLQAGNQVRCWGAGNWGVLGYYSTTKYGTSSNVGDQAGEMPPPLTKVY